MKKIRLMIIAGETSGDLQAASLIKSLKSINPHIEIFGMGGKKMQAESAEIIYDITNLAIVGFFEVLKHIFTFKKIFEKLSALLETRKPDAVILVDYPGFNLRFAKATKEKNIPVIYYISPQIWAWRGGRIKKIAQRVNKMLVILPFEAEIYRKAGVDVKFIGHPLFDVIDDSGKEKLYHELGLDPLKPIVGLLPGSRDKEVRFLLTSMLDAAVLIKKKIPESQFILPKAKEVDGNYVKRLIKEKGIDLKVVEGNSHGVFRIADLSIVCSGTATVEAAILGAPLIIIYRLSKITEIIGRKMLKVRHWGLVNILAGEEIVPELEQEEVNAENISAYAISILRSKQNKDLVKAKLSRITSTLGEKGASQKAAREIMRFLN